MTKRDLDAEKARNFLSRWSQRKQAAEQEVEAPDPAPAAGAPAKEKSRAGADSGLAATRPEAEPGTAIDAGEDAEAGFDLKDLPDIDSLEAGSDFTVFLRAGVPDALRRRALRKLWRVHPVLGIIDGLDDYNLDYTDAATVVPNMKTLYQVGRGMIRPEDEIAEAEAEAEAQAQAQSQTEADEAAARDPAAADRDAETPGESDAAGEGAGPDQVRLAESGESPMTSGGSADTEEAPEPTPRKRNPGDPVVSESAARGNAGRRAAVARPAARSARSRRWGDSNI